MDSGAALIFSKGGMRNQTKTLFYFFSRFYLLYFIFRLHLGNLIDNLYVLNCARNRGKCLRICRLISNLVLQVPNYH